MYRTVFRLALKEILKFYSPTLFDSSIIVIVLKKETSKYKQ